MRRAAQATAMVMVLTLSLSALARFSSAAVASKGQRRPTVLLLGDSITGLYAPYAVKTLESKGYKVIVVEHRGSGLLDKGRCDGTNAKRLATAFRPDITVIEYTGNYNVPDLNKGTLVSNPPPYFLPCDSTVTYWTPRFYKSWKRSVRKTTDAFDGRVAWVLVPAAARQPWGSVIPELNRLYKRIAKKRAAVSTIDAWMPFGGATYNPALHDTDGLHPNSAGAQKLAHLVVDRVEHLRH